MIHPGQRRLRVLALAERRGQRGPEAPDDRRAWLYALARWSCLRKLAEAKQKRHGAHALGRSEGAHASGRPQGAYACVTAPPLRSPTAPAARQQTGRQTVQPTAQPTADRLAQPAIGIDQHGGSPAVRDPGIGACRQGTQQPHAATVRVTHEGALRGFDEVLAIEPKAGRIDVEGPLLGIGQLANDGPQTSLSPRDEKLSTTSAT